MISDEVFAKEMDGYLKAQNVSKKERNERISYYLAHDDGLRDQIIEIARLESEKVKIKIPSEDEEQINFVYQFRKKYPDAILYCVRNDGSRTPSEKNKQVLMGVLAGVSDLVCPTYKMYIEMKRTKKYDHSDAQKEFERRAIKDGWHYILAIGCEDGITKVASVLNKGTVMDK